jgi:hypothetical protein
MVIMLKRDANSTKPPFGEVNLLQPKMRLQGFISELKSSLVREDPNIPLEVQIKTENLYEEGVTE